MSLIIEDGTEPANANSYASLAAANAYLANHDQAVAWVALGTPAKESLLIQARRALDASVTWKGYKTTALRELEWPRISLPYTQPVAPGFPTPSVPGFYPAGTIPAQVVNAQCELAALLMAGDRLGDVQGSGIESIGLGQGAVAIKFDHTTAAKIVGRFIPSLIADFITSTGGGKRSLPARRAFA